MAEQCPGCGADFQITNADMPGYLPAVKEEKKHDIVCQRCHKLMHQKQMISQVHDIPIDQLELPKKCLKVIVFDITTFPLGIVSLPEYKDVLFVGTKLDLLPIETDVVHLRNKLKQSFPTGLGHHVISAKTSQGMSEFVTGLNSHLDRYVNAAFIGYANMGKSTLLNRLLKMSKLTPTPYRQGTLLTYSKYPGTTVRNIEYPMYKMPILKHRIGKLIDTPGIRDEQSNYPLLSNKEIELITPKKRITPRTFTIPKYYNKSVFIGGVCRIDLEAIQEEPLKCVWFGATRLVPHVVATNKADMFYSNYANGINKKHGPPFQPTSLPPLLKHTSLTLQGNSSESTVVEIVVKNMGWFHLIKSKGSFQVTLHSPHTNSLFVRQPFVKSHSLLLSPTQRFFQNHILKLVKHIRL